MISVVILHYQATDETINCVDTIFRHVKTDKKVIIVDNSSPNGSGKVLEERYKKVPDIKVILTEKNLGFAMGNNIGFKEAKKYDPDYIMVMNNDVFIQQDDLIEKLNLVYEECRFDILGPDIYSTRDNIHQNPQRNSNYTLYELEQIRRKLVFKNRFSFFLRIKCKLPVKKAGDYKAEFHKKKSHNAELDKRDIFNREAAENVVLHGACYVFSRKYIINHSNCFYDKTFMYFESYILHYLGQRENLKLIYYPEIRVVHHEDVATDQTYKSVYEKSVFVNKCLLDSCNEFIKIMKEENLRLG